MFKEKMRIYQIGRINWYILKEVVIYHAKKFRQSIMNVLGHIDIFDKERKNTF